MASQVAQEAVVLMPVDAGRQTMVLRLRGLAPLIPALAAAGLSAWLTPRPEGHGTHQQLGLPPCMFLARTGYPCPSCGLTTSFAAMAHGQAGQAFAAHAAGPVLMLAMAALGLAGLGELLTGRDCLRLLRPGAWWAVVALASMLFGWGLKIILGVAGGTLPAR